MGRHESLTFRLPFGAHDTPGNVQKYGLWLHRVGKIEWYNLHWGVMSLFIISPQKS